MSRIVETWMDAELVYEQNGYSYSGPQNPDNSLRWCLS